MKKNCFFNMSTTQIAALQIGLIYLVVGLFAEITFAETKLGLSPTIYYIKLMDSTKACSELKTVVDPNGKPIVKICKEYYKLCVIEGTCAIIKSNTELSSIDSDYDANHDFELINYVNTIQGIARFNRVDTSRCPFGYGVKAICLDPYYSVAADLNFHSPGEVIFLPAAKGIVLPNSEVHDGYFIVRDRGGAIKGPNRFDFFTGFFHYKDPRNPFTPIGLANSNKVIEYRKIIGDEAVKIKTIRNFPLIPRFQN